MMFRDQVGILAGWFKGWNECEQTVALLSLLKRVTRTQARFLQLCLEHSLADCNDIHLLESEANSAAIVSQWQQESKEKVVSLLLSHLPLLQPRNTEAKSEYMRLLQKVLAYSIESNAFIEESRQLLSYALIHPAATPTAKDGGRGESLLPGAEPPLAHTSTDKGTEAKDPSAAESYPPPPAPAPTDGSEPAPAPVADGDIPSQFTRVMGKVCTQLLVSRPDEENITSYLQLIEKCLTHEAFTETQKKRLLSWKQQVLKLLRTFPRKAALEMQNYRQQKGWAFGSNSLPIAGSVGMGVARRTQRQFPLPPRALPPGRMGLLSPSGIGGISPRHALTSPSLGSQGRQNLWFANPGGSNSMPSQSRSSVQRTHSLPVHSSPQAILMFPPDCPVPGPDLEINPNLESLCLSMTEHALGDGTDKTSTI
uniref:Sterile alpha motif domain containing 4B n=1 Tax=Rousettus aegyptiacus TaxID=9407 RepID=A0A7J8CLD4_ROUAE|nr:sterile alpha motif domain containing 4B [Rousettus aegyptiacus]